MVNANIKSALRNDTAALVAAFQGRVQQCGTAREPRFVTRRNTRERARERNEAISLARKLTLTAREQREIQKELAA